MGTGARFLLNKILELLESRFDIHLRIPAEFEKVFEDLQKIVDDADASQVYVWDPGAEDVLRDSSQLLGIEDHSVSIPASGVFQPNHHLYPPVSVPPEPRQSPQFLSVVVYVAMETNLSVLDKITCKVDVKIWDPGAVCWTTCLHSNTMVFSNNSTNQCYVRVTTRATNSHLRAFPWPGECNAFMQPWIFLLSRMCSMQAQILKCEELKLAAKGHQLENY